MRAILESELTGDSAFMPASDQGNRQRIASGERERCAGGNIEIGSRAAVDCQRVCAAALERDRTGEVVRVRQL